MIAAADCTSSPVVEAPDRGADHVFRELRVLQAMRPGSYMLCRHS